MVRIRATGKGYGIKSYREELRDRRRGLETIRNEGWRGGRGRLPILTSERSGRLPTWQTWYQIGEPQT